MNWHTGLKRLRLTGIGSLILGALGCIATVTVRGLGYAPDTAVAPLFAAMWPIGLVLVVVGALSLIAVWIAQGFAPSKAAGPIQPLPPPESRL